MSQRWVVIRGDGVSYRHGTRAPLEHAEPVGVGPDAETAAEVARLFLEAREGDDRQLVSGWLAVRWLRAGAWEGPAWLFAWEAPADGPLSVQPSGTDDEDWPLPDLG